MESIFEAIKIEFNKRVFKFEDSAISFKLNIIVQTNEEKIGKFPDFLYLVYRDYKLSWRIHQYECMCPEHLIKGQYTNAYKIGSYKEKKLTQTALVQRSGTVRIKGPEDTVINNFVGAHIVYPEATGANTIKLSSVYHYKDMFKIFHFHREYHGNEFSLTIL